MNAALKGIVIKRVKEATPPPPPPAERKRARSPSPPPPKAKAESTPESDSEGEDAAETDGPSKLKRRLQWPTAPETPHAPIEAAQLGSSSVSVPQTAAGAGLAEAWVAAHHAMCAAYFPTAPARRTSLLRNAYVDELEVGPRKAELWLGGDAAKRARQ